MLAGVDTTLLSWLCVSSGEHATASQTPLCLFVRQWSVVPLRGRVTRRADVSTAGAPPHSPLLILYQTATGGWLTLLAGVRLARYPLASLREDMPHRPAEMAHPARGREE